MLEKEIEYKTNIKTIEEKNKHQVLEAEKNFKERLEKQIDENKEQLNNKLENLKDVSQDNKIVK